MGNRETKTGTERLINESMLICLKMEKNGEEEEEDELYLGKRQSDGEINGEIPFKVVSSDLES